MSLKYFKNSAVLLWAQAHIFYHGLIFLVQASCRRVSLPTEKPREDISDFKATILVDDDDKKDNFPFVTQ